MTAQGLNSDRSPRPVFVTPRSQHDSSSETNTLRLVADQWPQHHSQYRARDVSLILTLAPDASQKQVYGPKGGSRV